MKNICQSLIILVVALSPSVSCHPPVLEKRVTLQSTTIVTSTIISTVSNTISQYIGDNGAGTPVIVTDKNQAATFRFVDQQLYANGRYYGGLPVNLNTPNAPNYRFEGGSVTTTILTKTYGINAQGYLSYDNAGLGKIAKSSGGGAVFCHVGNTVYLSGTISYTYCPAIQITAQVLGISGSAATITQTLEASQPAFTSSIIGAGTSADTVIIGSPLAATTTSRTTIIDGLPALTTSTVRQVSTTPGQIIVEIPASTVTTTSSGAFPSTTTSIISQQDTTPGTILILAPTTAPVLTPTGPELVTNGDFEQGFDGYTSSDGNTGVLAIAFGPYAHDGSNAADFEAGQNNESTGNVELIQDITTTAGRSYRATFYVKNTAGSAGQTFVAQVGANTYFSENLGTGRDYVQQTFDFPASSGTSTLTFKLLSPVGSNSPVDVYLDEISVRLLQ